MTPKVAIRCITYNHEPYIRDALEGFVMQKTSFPFVAVVHDDASTDGTADIIREYAEKYPDIIKPLYETENQYSKGDGSMSRMMNQAVLDTGAKYVALCEGDDYWTDPLKLQKQVDFLETHPDYSMVFSNATAHWEDNRYPDKQIVQINVSREIFPIEIFKGLRIPTASVVIHSSVFQSPIYKGCMQLKQIPFGDIQLFIACGHIGRIWYLSELVSFYRKHDNGACAAFEKNQLPHIRGRIRVARFFGEEYVKIEKVYCSEYLIPTIKHLFKNFPDNLNLIFRIIIFSPYFSIRQIVSHIFPQKVIRYIKKFR